MSPHDHIVLQTAEMSQKETAIKLEQSLAHSCIDKLLALINNSGKQRAENKNLKRELRTLQKIYQHKNLQKSLPRLVAPNSQPVPANNCPGLKRKLWTHYITFNKCL